MFRAASVSTLELLQSVPVLLLAKSHPNRVISSEFFVLVSPQGIIKKQYFVIGLIKGITESGWLSTLASQMCTLCSCYPGGPDTCLCRTQGPTTVCGVDLGTECRNNYRYRTMWAKSFQPEIVYLEPQRHQTHRRIMAHNLKTWSYRDIIFHTLGCPGRVPKGLCSTYVRQKLRT